MIAVALRSSHDLKRRLKEIERERAALDGRIETLHKAPDASFAFPPAPRPAARLRPPAVPGEWLDLHPDRIRSLPRGEETLRNAGLLVSDDDASLPPESPDFAPGPADVTVKHVSAPVIRRSAPLTPPLHANDRGRVPRILVEPEHDRLRTYLGSNGFARGHLRSRSREGSYRARAIFVVLLVLLLGFLVVRWFT